MKNPSLRTLGLNKLLVGQSAFLPIAVVPNLAAFRVNVYQYSIAHRMKLSVHKNKDEIEIARVEADVATVTPDFVTVRKSTPRR